MSNYQPDPGTVAAIADRILHIEIGAVLEIGAADISEMCEEEIEQLYGVMPQHEADRAADVLIAAVRAQVTNNPIIAGQCEGAPAVGSRSPTDPNGLGEWLRALPEAILQDRHGIGAQVTLGVVKQEATVICEFPALRSFACTRTYDVSEGSPDLAHLAAAQVPFVLLSRGAPAPAADAGA